jgi:hypothetical protein
MFCFAGIADFAPIQLEDGVLGGKPKFTSFQEVVDRAAVWVKQSHVCFVELCLAEQCIICHFL